MPPTNRMSPLTQTDGQREQNNHCDVLGHIDNYAAKHIARHNIKHDCRKGTLHQKYMVRGTINHVVVTCRRARQNH